MSAMPSPDAAPIFRPGFLARARQLFDRRETIRYLVTSNLKAGHRDKVLGHLWSMLDPLLFMAVYYVVFGLIFGQAAQRRTEFMLYLFVGVLAWRFLDATVSQSALCIRGNRGLIHEINFPKAIFPIAVCLARLYDFAWGLLVYVGVLLVAGHSLSPMVVWLPLLLLLQLTFVTGIAFGVAYLGAFYADTPNVATVAMRLWFYSTPIFYFLEGPNAPIPERFRPLMLLNPVAAQVENYRRVLISGGMPDFSLLAYSACAAALALIVGFALFGRGEGTFAKYV
ncbi:Teichoic acid translocation permease protein TagG [Phycisphaerae bacterium RAS1]|nr:Teichoic acid translocation permease protein TagG [Phycisphaerae bacterium RAS1]